MKEEEKTNVAQCSARREQPLGRREVLKVGTIGALASCAVVGKALAGHQSTKTRKRYAMVIDLRRCIGCHALGKAGGARKVSEHAAPFSAAVV
jgi:hypothetical protein